MTVQVDISDLQKIRRALELAEQAQRATDEVNAARHATHEAIHSPLTTLLRQEIERVIRLMGLDNPPGLVR